MLVEELNAGKQVYAFKLLQTRDTCIFYLFDKLQYFTVCVLFKSFYNEKPLRLEEGIYAKDV